MKKYIFTIVFILIGLTKTWGQEGYIGEIRMFAGNFAPRGWMLCQGQLLPISTNTALFSLLGTTYGGDGRTTFALPDLRGRTPIGTGNGPALSPKTLGEIGGTETVTLIASQIPPHTHPLYVSSNTGSTDTPASNEMIAAPANMGPNPVKTYTASGNAVQLAPSSVGWNTSSGQPHDNMMPYTTINFIICTEGVFPSRP